MESFIVNPREVSSLGNILSPRDAEHISTNHAVLTDASMEVNNETSPVLTMSNSNSSNNVTSISVKDLVDDGKIAATVQPLSKASLVNFRVFKNILLQNTSLYNETLQLDENVSGDWVALVNFRTSAAKVMNLRLSDAGREEDATCNLQFVCDGETFKITYYVNNGDETVINLDLLNASTEYFLFLKSVDGVCTAYLNGEIIAVIMLTEEFMYNNIIAARNIEYDVLLAEDYFIVSDINTTYTSDESTVTEDAKMDYNDWDDGEYLIITSSCGKRSTNSFFVSDSGTLLTEVGGVGIVINSMTYLGRG